MFLLMSDSSQENGIAVTTGTPAALVDVIFPEPDVEMGAAVIAGELEGSSTSLVAGGELLARSALDSLALLALELAASVLELPTASARELTVSALELEGEAVEMLAAASAGTLVVEVKVRVSVR